METRKLQRILFVQRILITFKARRVDRQWIDYIAFWQFPGSGNVSQRLRINLNFARWRSQWVCLRIFTEGFESYQDPLNKQYPLQLTGFHYKSRVHSTYGNVDVLKAACRQEMWINPLDAQKRGINNGDKVRIFNDRGEVHIEAKVTPRMMPGVVALGEGAWYDPDTKRVDKGGCINVLTTQRPSPLAKGNPSHTNLVQVEKV